MTNDDLLARLDGAGRWGDANGARLAREAAAALRAAEDRKPLFKGSPATFRKIIGDDLLGPDLPDEIVVYPAPTEGP